MWIVVIVVLALVGFAIFGSPKSSAITGTVTYDENIALAQGSVMEVKLLDVSKADVPATVVAETSIPIEGRSVPIPFTLSYDPSQINDTYPYLVSARILENGTPVFITVKQVPVITWNHPTSGITIPVSAASALSRPELYGPVWVWEKTEMGDGTVITPKKPDAFTLSFTNDGKISGTTDCNNFSGSYTLSPGDVISFTPFASTLMFCADSQETEFREDVARSNQVFFTEAGNLVLLLPFDSGSVMFKKK